MIMKSLNLHMINIYNTLYLCKIKSICMKFIQNYHNNTKIEFYMITVVCMNQFCSNIVLTIFSLK